MSEPEGQESGGALRAQFEATRKVLVEKVVAANPGITASDLDGVDPTQFDAKAEEVMAGRQAEADRLLTEALKAKGVEDGDLDKVLAALKADKPKEKAETPASRVASLGSIGAPTASKSKNVNTEGLTGRDRILAARERKAQS